MLTYETLSRIAGEEKTNPKPAGLPESFFQEVRSYLENKSRMGEGKEDLWELDSARRLLQDILERREGKILSMALFNVRSGLEPENLTPEEADFFNTVVSNIREFQTKRKLIIDGKPEKKEVVAILEEIPQFVGPSMETYGPYRKGDIVTLPQEIAKILVDKKAVKRIEVA